MTNQHRRSIKNLLINRHVQFRIVYYFLAMLILLVGVFEIAIYFIFYDLKELATATPLTASELGYLIDEKLIKLMGVNSIFLLGALMITFVYGLYISHRLAGPMHAVLQYIDVIKSGNYKTTRDLRPADELFPVMTALNELSAELGKKYN